MTKTDTETKELTPEDVAAKRAALLAQLADLPADPAPPGLTPGTKFGTGVSQDIVPYTSDFFQKNYELKEVFPTKSELIGVNGVWFAIYAGRKCFLPDPHYQVYQDSLRAGARMDEQFAPPTDVSAMRDGYMSPVHKMGDGPIRRDDK